MEFRFSISKANQIELAKLVKAAPLDPISSFSFVVFRYDAHSRAYFATTQMADAAAIVDKEGGQYSIGVSAEPRMVGQRSVSDAIIHFKPAPGKSSSLAISTGTAAGKSSTKPWGPGPAA